jgi:RimJ/RimL family protein N-acetyltransferase
LGLGVQVETERLVLREWRDTDREPFAALNADPEVMAHFPSVLTRTQSEALVERVVSSFAEQGWGLWATEVKATGEFIGFVGLAIPTFRAPFMPCVEIGWRLARDAWGHGYAPEGARASARFGFDELGLDEIVSFTSVTNTNSQRVMQKIGMTHDPADDFDHPNVPPGNPLRRHVLYRLGRPR